MTHTTDAQHHTDGGKNDASCLHEPKPYAHAAGDYTAEELLLVYIAERLEAMAERMVTNGHQRIGLFGSREHAIWLTQRINAMRTLPIVAYVDRPDRTGERTDIGVPVFQITDAGLAEHIDTLLVIDDRCERALRDLAHQHMPPSMLVWTLYDRLDIGNEPIAAHPGVPRAASQAEPKFGVPQRVTGSVAGSAPGSGTGDGSGARLAKLTAATVHPI